LRSRPLAVCLALACSAGCMALGRETYTSPVGPGARAIFAPEDVPIGKTRRGHAFSQDPSAVVAASPPAEVGVSVCDWSESLWFLVFPPLPLPLISMEDQPGRPHTTVVRITFAGPGQWRANFAELALLGPEGKRAEPDRYKLVIARKAESLVDGAMASTLEPCQRTIEPHASVATSKFAVLETGELFVSFDTTGWESGDRALALDGITRDGAKVEMPKLELQPGARWFWYRAFP
jgi:hypothetical protein